MNKILAITLVAAAVVFAVQSRRASRLSMQNEAAAAQLAGASRHLPSPAELDKLRQAASEADTLRPQTRDLHKLRNDVRQLREQTRDFENVRALNAKLKESIANPESDPELQQFERDYIPADELADAGLATPEDAVQTYFWAAKNGNVHRLAQCLPGKTSAEFEAIGADEKQRLGATLQKEFATLPGIRILAASSDPSQEPVAGLPAASALSKVTVKVQSSFGGNAIPFSLIWETNAWKIAEGNLLR